MHFSQFQIVVHKGVRIPVSGPIIPFNTPCTRCGQILGSHGGSDLGCSGHCRDNWDFRWLPKVVLLPEGI